MKLAVYYPWIYLTSGIERTLLEMAKLEGHTVTFFTNHFEPDQTYPEFKQLNVIQLKYVPVKRDLISVIKAALTISTQKIDLASFDRLIVHSDGLADLILLRNSSIPTILFCHTPLRPVFDPVYRQRVLMNKSTLHRLNFHLFSAIFRLIDRFLYSKYSTLIFNSQETTNRAKNGHLLDHVVSSKIHILHPGIDLKKAKTGEFKPYFLLPGRIMWTKNIELAISSFIRFQTQLPSSEFSLIIAGQVDAKSQIYLKKLQRVAQNRTDITFIENPSDAKLRELYSKCYAVLSPAFNEDWGLTLLEGNAHGKPVIAINQGGPKESQIDGQTGYLVKPTITAFTYALTKMVDNPQRAKRLGANATEHVKSYDWSHFRQALNQLVSA